MTDRPIRVLLVDDHELVREGLRMFLAEEAEMEVVGEAANGTEAVALTGRVQPDVVLMDVLMPGMDGVEATRRIRARHPACQVLMLTSFAEDQHVRAALQAGAIGYLLKDVLKPELLRAIRAAAQGQPTLHPLAQQGLIRQLSRPAATSRLDDLTGREREVLRLVAQGRSNKEIAAALRLTEGTVKGYVSAILTKLGVEDRTQAALYAVKHGLVAME